MSALLPDLGYRPERVKAERCGPGGRDDLPVQADSSPEGLALRESGVLPSHPAAGRV
ncbi:MAG: hypothetical protein NVSMB32_15470 [Actinomycetota bacterium]